MPRPIHFEIPADDPQRAADFYAAVFGWEFTKWDGPMPYWMVKTGQDGQPGIDGGLMPREQPGASTVNVLDVASVDDALAAIEKHGGTTIAPKTHIPGVGHVAYFNDTEGNTLGIIQAE